MDSNKKDSSDNSPTACGENTDDNLAKELNKSLARLGELLELMKNDAMKPLPTSQQIMDDNFMRQYYKS